MYIVILTDTPVAHKFFTFERELMIDYAQTLAGEGTPILMTNDLDTLFSLRKFDANTLQVTNRTREEERYEQEYLRAQGNVADYEQSFGLGDK